MTARLTGRSALLLLIPPLLWAGNAVVGRMVAGQVPPLALNAGRWVIALLILLPLGWRAVGTADARRRILERWRPLALLGLLGVGAYNSLQYTALITSSALNATLIVSSGPVWMLLVGAVFYGERPTARAVVGSLLSLAGVLVVISRGDLLQLARIAFVPGDLLMLLASIVWSFYSWQLARPHPSLAGAQRPDWNWAEFLLVQVIFGLLWALAASGVEAAVTPITWHWSPWLMAVFAYIAIGPSVLAYRFWGVGVASAGPAVATLFGNLTPLFAAVLSAAVLGEGPAAYHGLAFVLIVAGIAAASSFRK